MLKPCWKRRPDYTHQLLVVLPPRLPGNRHLKQRNNKSTNSCAGDGENIPQVKQMSVVESTQLSIYYTEDYRKRAMRWRFGVDGGDVQYNTRATRRHMTAAHNPIPSLLIRCQDITVSLHVYLHTQPHELESRVEIIERACYTPISSIYIQSLFFIYIILFDY